MRVYVYPADTEGCGSYRMTWPAWALHAQGHDIRVVSPAQRANMLVALPNEKTGKIEDVYVPEDADVIVLQRISHIKLVESIPIIRAMGIAVVIDIDDDLSAIHPHNPAFTLMHPRNMVNAEHSWKNVQRACEAATHVVVSTPALAKIYASHGRVSVLRNCVPKRYLDIQRHDSDMVGWGGAVHSHPDDLQALGTSIAKLQREGIPFRIVGSGDDVTRVLQLDEEPDVTGIVDLATAWPETLSSLGVGVAPLAETRFNKSKSWLKMLEMAAVGVPCVVSPLPEYRALNKLGVGLLADKPQRWYAQLKKLTADAALRAELSAQGRDVARNHTVEDNAWRWLEAWETAWHVDRGKRAPKVIASPFKRQVKKPPAVVLQERKLARLQAEQHHPGATNDRAW